MSPSAAPGGSWRARSPFRVAFPSSIDGRVLAQVTVDEGAVRGRSASVATALLWVLAVGGITLAVVGAIAEDRAGSEAVGAFGVEAGAALWFAGAVTLGARPRPTVARALLLLGLALGGAVLVVLAVLLDWDGPALTLAMEFGVGSMAVAVIDVVLLGILHPGLEGYASRSEDLVVTLSLGGAGRLVAVRKEAPQPEPAAPRPIE